jgi:hypothetical protein
VKPYPHSPILPPPLAQSLSPRRPLAAASLPCSSASSTGIALLYRPPIQQHCHQPLIHLLLRLDRPPPTRQAVSIWVLRLAFTEMMAKGNDATVIFLVSSPSLAAWHRLVHIDSGETYRPAGMIRRRRLLGRRDATHGGGRSRPASASRSSRPSRRAGKRGQGEEIKSFFSGAPKIDVPIF